MRAGLQGVVDNQPLDAIGERLDETIVNTLGND
jgi:hypothetical protein